MDPTSRPSDEELLVLAREGDREAFRSLHDRYRSALIRYLFAGCGRSDAAEDLCQEVFFRVWRFAHYFRSDLEFRPWLFTIAGNELRRHLRRWKVMADVETVEPADLTRPVEALDRSDAVLQALAKLPLEQQEVVRMKEYGGLTFAEIAKVMDCSENTAKSRMYYGLTKLREHLKEFAPDAR